MDTQSFGWIHMITGKYTQSYGWIHRVTGGYTGLQIATQGYVWIHRVTFWIYMITCGYTDICAMFVIDEDPLL